MRERTPPTTIVLLGMMGAGKTTVGQALVARTGWRYMDNDELVRAATGRAPEEIDATDGTDALHAAEAAALRRALSMPGPLIAAAAAWVATDPDSVTLLERAPAVGYLRAQPQTLHGRIGAGDGRREDATDLDWLQARFRERDATYRRLGSVTIDTDGASASAVAAEILAVIG